MKSISVRLQLWLIGLGYAAILAGGAGLFAIRYLLAVTQPGAASGGMYAFGDLMLAIFLALLLMIPTIFLVRLLAGFEALYTTFSQLLVGLSLSAPVGLSLLSFGDSRIPESLRSLGLVRLAGSPLILILMGASRLFAKFDRAKKLTLYALLIEGMTLVVGVALFIHSR